MNPAGTLSTGRVGNWRPARRPAPRGKRIRTAALYAIEAAICIAVLVGLGLGYRNYMHTGERLRLRHIDIRGLEFVPRDAVRQAAGLTALDDVFDFDPAEVAKKIEAMPGVKHCTVQRVYPRDVVITVQERQPVATLLVDKRAYAIDEDGAVLRMIDALESHPGPLIANVRNLGQVKPGQLLDNEDVRAAIAVWRAFSLAPMSQEIVLSELSAAEPGTITMYAERLSYEIRWGCSDYTRQATLLDLLWRRKHGLLPCQQYLDLRFDNDLVCK